MPALINFGPVCKPMLIISYEESGSEIHGAHQPFSFYFLRFTFHALLFIFTVYVLRVTLCVLQNACCALAFPRVRA